MQLEMFVSPQLRRQIEEVTGRPWLAQRRAYSLCGRMVSWLRNAFSLQNACKLAAVAAIAYLAKNQFGRIDTSTWDHQCPTSREVIVQKYEQVFQERAQHSLTMHKLYAPSLDPDETAICLTTSWPDLVDEVKGTRCFSNGRQIPVGQVQTDDHDCQILAATTCPVNCSSDPYEQPHRKIKLQRVLH